MKEAIEKAIENGYHPLGGKAKPLKVAFDDDMQEAVITYDGWDNRANIYVLIFGTDFIDKLVGDGVYCLHYKKPCDRKQNCGKETWLKGNALYDFHRSKMANIQDHEKLKEYVWGLI